MIVAEPVQPRHDQHIPIVTISPVRFYLTNRQIQFLDAESRKCGLNRTEMLKRLLDQIIDSRSR